MANRKNHVTAVAVLQEIEKILETEYYQSRESGKRFYDKLNFPAVLGSYIVSGGQNLGANAKRFGMSRSTLKKILGGGPLSENMLFRIRSALVVEVASQANKLVFPGDWHEVSAETVHTAISDVSRKLVFLKKVVEGSNFLNSENSPIDRVQVLQLVALLSATLEALRAPFVEKKQTRGFFRWLGNLAKKSAEKGAEKIVVDAMSDAVSAGNDLIHSLSSNVSAADLGDII